MKRDELKKHIKDHIRETLYAGQKTVPAAQKDPAFSKLAGSDRTAVVKKLQSGGSVELAEMARISKVYKIDPDFRKKAETIETGGPISPVKLKNVLDFLDGKETTTGPDIAAGVGYAGLMPRIYPIFAALIEKGALTLTSDDKKVDIPDTPENHEVPAKPYKFMDTDPDEEEEGGEEEEDTYYKPDEEDEVPEEEPDVKGLAKRTTVIDDTARKAAAFFMDNDRLLTSIIRSYKDTRSHIKEARDEEDISPEDYKKMLQQTKETSVTRLARKIDEFVAKIKELEPEVQQKVIDILDFKLKSVNAEYVGKLIAKKVGLSIKKEIPIEVPAELDIEDEDDEELVEGSTEDFDDFDQIYEQMQKLAKL